MDPNTYVFVAVLNGLRQKELGVQPPETAFTPFDLSALRQTPKRLERTLKPHGTPNQPLRAQVEATA